MTMIATMLLIADALIHIPGQPVPTQVVQHGGGVTVVHQPGQAVPTTIVNTREFINGPYENSLQCMGFMTRPDKTVFHPKGDKKCRLCKGKGLMVVRPNATLDNPKNWCKCVKKAKKAWDAEQKSIQNAQK